MSTEPIPPSRGPALAAQELLVLQKWEEFAAWILGHTAKWARSARFTLTQRVENHVLDVVESLVVARYDPRARPTLLADVNLRLERLRFLLRLAHERNLQSTRSFEAAMRGIDETGRMLHGWRQKLGARGPANGAQAITEVKP